MSVVRAPASRSAAADRELMAQLAAGNLSALGALHDRYYGSVLGVVVHAGVERGDADDVTQEVFLKLIALAARFDGRESARAWILGIAWKMALHRRRGGARWLRMLGEVVAEVASAATTDPERLAIVAEEASSFERRVARLPARMQAAFILVEVQGLTGEEAASALGIPVATVWTRLHHARRKMMPGAAGGER
ncbi:MAG: RNA polymerase sigma factor [Myxococcaceae bacterium]|nr:MAG: RNA polymerase sigma factor [Myxococcaceae bacterium]